MAPVNMTMIKRIAEPYHIPPELVAAIITVESNFDNWANRYEGNWRWFLSPKVWAKRLRITNTTERINQMTSWGLMQIMGATAREIGLKGPIPSLCDPTTGIEYGCRYLKIQLKRYDNRIPHAVSAYNAGGARFNRKKEFRNQGYVDHVMVEYREYLSGG